VIDIITKRGVSRIRPSSNPAVNKDCRLRSVSQYTHCGKVFELIDRRFAIDCPLQESLGGRRHENEENATEIRNLHRGGAECQAGGGDASSVPEA